MIGTNFSAYVEHLDGPVLMAHALMGFPSLEASRAVIDGLVVGGAHILELQIPFSDPLADGPTIMLASEAALRAGFNVRDAFALIEYAAKTGVPIVVMSYLNPILQYGIAQFVSDAVHAGASGFIVPDAPCDTEEGIELRRSAAEFGAAVIEVVSPGVRRERLEMLAQCARGFVYATSRQGITGADSAFLADLRSYIDTVRSVFKLPVALGFGVRTCEDFVRASMYADIVVAGSVFVEAVRDAADPRAAATEAVQKVRGR